MLPSRQPFGSFFSFFAFPPPRTTSSGWNTSITRAVDELDMLLPFLPAQPFQGLDAEVVLVCAVLEWQVCQFHGNDDAICHQRGAQAGSETQKQQQSASWL